MEYSLNTKQMYQLNNHRQAHGIEGYLVEKRYIDPTKIAQERQLAKIKKGEKDRRHVTKRGNFLDDQTNVHKMVPGPGQYPKVDQWPQKRKLKVNYADKKTYVDEIIKLQKKEKKPAPGQYNTFKSLKEQEEDVKRLAAKKINHHDRLTYLDKVQFQASQTPGVGNYNPRKRAKTEITQSQTKIKPEEWRKKHDLIQKKKPPKTPDMRTYQPTPSDYLLFDGISKVKQNKNLQGKVERFKTEASGSGLPPAKYTVLQQWRGKQKKKLERHGLQVLSKSSTYSKSVYYH